MKARNIISIILLLFVTVSVVTAVAKEIAREPEPEGTVAAAPVDAEGPQFIAYYFHSNVRCKSCKKIENFTRTTIEDKYADQLEDGLLEFSMVNTDEPENRHFIKDYSLYTKHVVLTEFIDGKQTRWKNLDRVWELLGDEEVFRGYIDVEVSNFLDNVPDEGVVWVDAGEPAGGAE